MSHVKFPDIEVKLSGTDGNAYAIMASVKKALCRAGVAEADVKAYLAESQAGDYNNLLRVAMAWVEVT